MKRGKMITAMLDTNAFDYIYEKNLEPKLKEAVSKESLRLFITHVQLDEINKMRDERKKEYSLKAIESIPVFNLLTTIGYVGSSEESKHGYIGGRIGMMRIAGDDTAAKLESLKKQNMKNPMKNTADLTILQTAIDNDLDYIITQNDADFNRELESLKKIVNKNVKLKIAHNAQLDLLA